MADAWGGSWGGSWGSSFTSSLPVDLGGECPILLEADGEPILLEDGTDLLLEICDEAPVVPITPVPIVSDAGGVWRIYKPHYYRRWKKKRRHEEEELADLIAEVLLDAPSVDPSVEKERPSEKAYEGVVDLRRLGPATEDAVAGLKRVAAAAARKAEQDEEEKQ